MALKDVAIQFESGRITVSPDPVRVDWRSEDGVRWELSSSDGGAVLEEIVFKQHRKGPPFARVAQHPSNKKVWQCDGCKKLRGRFKYDIVVVDGNGRKVVLDPAVMTGDPPRGN